MYIFLKKVDFLLIILYRLYTTYKNSCSITAGYIRLYVSAVTRPSSGEEEIAECNQL